MDFIFPIPVGTKKSARDQGFPQFSLPFLLPEGTPRSVRIPTALEHWAITDLVKGALIMRWPIGDRVPPAPIRLGTFAVRAAKPPANIFGVLGR
jgi:hypothetical protein